jgi:hypothetical protein
MMRQDMKQAQLDELVKQNGFKVRYYLQVGP